MTKSLELQFKENSDKLLLIGSLRKQSLILKSEIQEREKLRKQTIKDLNELLDSIEEK
jgi:hypothetical protein